MKKRITILTACMSLALAGCTTIQLADGTALTTIGGTKALENLSYTNQTYGIGLGVVGYQGNQSEDFQAMIALMNRLMTLAEKAAVAP